MLVLMFMQHIHMLYYYTCVLYMNTYVVLHYIYIYVIDASCSIKFFNRIIYKRYSPFLCMCPLFHFCVPHFCILHFCVPLILTKPTPWTSNILPSPFLHKTACTLRLITIDQGHLVNLLFFICLVYQYPHVQARWRLVLLYIYDRFIHSTVTDEYIREIYIFFFFRFSFPSSFLARGIYHGYIRDCNSIMHKRL